MTMTWASRFEQTDSPFFGAARVAGDYTDTELDLTVTLDSDEFEFAGVDDDPFPTGINQHARECSISITGTASVRHIAFGGIPSGLK